MRRLGLLCAAVLLLAATGWAFSDPAPALLRAAILKALLPALPWWDRFAERMDPHEASQGPPRRADLRPLREQARQMWADMLARFVTRGGELILISTPPVEVGDMCLWQGVYAATVAIDAQLRGDEASRRRAERAFEGLRLLGSRGRPLARAVLPVSVVTERVARWYYRDDHWQWKEDASVDSAAGWVFGCLVVIEAVPSRRAEALRALRSFADQLIDGGLRLRNSDGRPTRFSSMGGALINSPVGLLCSLAAFRTLERHGQGRRYGEAHDELVAQGQVPWAAYGSASAPWRNTTTNHNIAHLALVSAMLAEDDPGRWGVYARGLLRQQRTALKMGNSFWLYLAEWAFARRPELAGTLAGDPAYEAYRAARGRRLIAARRSMAEFSYPAQKVKRRTRNSGRVDLSVLRSPIGTFSRRPLPIHERPPADFVWQRSPYSLDGWNDVEGAGQDYMPLDFLAAYTLGRAIGALSGDE